MAEMKYVGDKKTAGNLTLVPGYIYDVRTVSQHGTMMTISIRCSNGHAIMPLNQQTFEKIWQQ